MQEGDGAELRVAPELREALGVIEGLKGNPEANRERRLRDAQRLEELLEEHLSRMSRWAACG